MQLLWLQTSAGNQLTCWVSPWGASVSFSPPPIYFVLLPSCYADACIGLSGFILQQILITPNLPFTVEHAILAATATKPPHADPEFIELSLGGLSRPPSNKLTPEERKQRAISIARQMTELGYDKEWLKVPENQALVEKKIPEAMVARPSLIIGELPF